MNTGISTKIPASDQVVVPVMFTPEKTGYYFSLGDGSGDKTEYYKSSDNRFGYLMFGNIGYRYQRVSGFMFRVGIGDKNGLKKSAACPYIGLGWSF